MKTSRKQGKNKAALEMVRLRLKKLSPERRQEIARHAAKVRWARMMVQP
jgi:hypothetical protein